MKYVKFLYMGCSTIGDILSLQMRTMIDESRYQAVLDLIPQIETDPITYCANTCLLCALHTQNTLAITSDGYMGTYLFLQGGEKFLGESVGNTRDLETGDTLLYPTYDITKITADLAKESTL